MKVKYLLLSIVPVLVLAGCGFGPKGDKKVEAAGQKSAVNMPEGVLAVWADGSSMISQKEVDEVLALAMKEQPELQGMNAAFMPMLKQNILNALVQHKVIEKYIEENKLNETAEYKSKLEQFVKSIKQKINVDFLAKEFENIAATEKDNKEYYDKNKDRFAVVSRGGVKAAGVKFDKETDAQAFLAKVAGKVAEFEKTVKADVKLAKMLQDFNYVSAESRLEKALVDGILTAKVPGVIIVKVDDKNIWVVKVSEKKESQYRSFDDIKDQIKQMRQGEALMNKLTELQKKYGVAVKENAFAPKQENKVADASDEQQQEAEKVAETENTQEVEKATKAA